MSDRPTLESRFQSKVFARWRGMGGHAARVDAALGGCDPGTPDSVLSIEGRGGWVEFKVWPRRLEPMQLPWHTEAVRSGAYAVVVCLVGPGRAWIGLAEDYARLTTRPKGPHLQVVLDMIRFALIRDRSA